MDTAITDAQIKTKMKGFRISKHQNNNKKRTPNLMIKSTVLSKLKTEGLVLNSLMKNYLIFIFN